MSVIFAEVDEAGNIVHVCSDPNATITPVVNRVKFRDKDGNDLKHADGTPMSFHGNKMLRPIRIDQATFDMLMADSVNNFTYDVKKKTFTRKSQ